MLGRLKTSHASAGSGPRTDLACIRLDRDKVGTIEERHRAIAGTTALILPRLVLDIRYSSDGADDGVDTAHATSISPPLQVTKTTTERSRASQIHGYLQTHPLRLNLSAIEHIHNEFSGEYTIAEIIDERRDAQGEGFEYRVRWEGFDDPAEDTWELEANVQSTEALEAWQQRDE